MRRFSAHLGYLFTEYPLKDRLSAARRNGFHGVEHPAPYAMSAKELHARLVEAGLPFVQMALPAGDPSRGDKGLAAIPDRVVEFCHSISVGLDYAARIGCPAVHAMSGVPQPGLDGSLVWDTYIANMAKAADAAAERGLMLLIEPIGSATLSGYYMDKPTSALRAIAELARPNVKMIFDVFHSVNGGVDPVAFILENAPLIYHLHIADHPGRHEPGTGVIDFSELYQTLDDAGYVGLVGCEYLPSHRTEDGLGWLAQQTSGSSP